MQLEVETEKQAGGRQGLKGEGLGESVFHGDRVSVLQGEEFCGWTVVMVVPPCECP